MLKRMLAFFGFTREFFEGTWQLLLTMGQIVLVVMIGSVVVFVLVGIASFLR